MARVLHMSRLCGPYRRRAVWPFTAFRKMVLLYSLALKHAVATPLWQQPSLPATLLYVIRRGGIRQALLRKSGNWIRASLARFLAQLLQGAGVLIVHSIGGI